MEQYRKIAYSMSDPYHPDAAEGNLKAFPMTYGAIGGAAGAATVGLAAWLLAQKLKLKRAGLYGIGAGIAGGAVGAYYGSKLGENTALEINKHLDKWIPEGYVNVEEDPATGKKITTFTPKEQSDQIVRDLAMTKLPLKQGDRYAMKDSKGRSVVLSGFGDVEDDNRYISEDEFKRLRRLAGDTRQLAREYNQQKAERRTLPGGKVFEFFGIRNPLSYLPYFQDWKNEDMAKREEHSDSQYTEQMREYMQPYVDMGIVDPATFKLRKGYRVH